MGGLILLVLIVIVVAFVVPVVALAKASQAMRAIEELRERLRVLEPRLQAPREGVPAEPPPIAISAGVERYASWYPGWHLMICIGGFWSSIVGQINNYLADFNRIVGVIAMK